MSGARFRSLLTGRLARTLDEIGRLAAAEYINRLLD